MINKLHVSLLYSAYTKFGINLLGAHNRKSVQFTNVCLSDFPLRLPAGDTWIFVVIHGGCNNLGSVPSRQQHKEPTAKDKASLNPKASFLFPVLKKTRLQTSSLKGTANRSCPHASPNSGKAHHTNGPDAEWLHRINNYTLLSKERARGTNPKEIHMPTRTPWCLSHYRR